MTSWVSVLLIANVAVYFLQSTVPWLDRLLLFWPPVALVQPWRFVTYMFLHGGFTHLLFNMLALYFFGPQVEARLGGRAFLGLWLVSGVAGALLHMFFTGGPMIGASAGVFGVQLAFARYWPRERIFIWGVLPVEARVLVVVMTALALFGGFSGSRDGVAHFAHLGGFVGGWIFLAIRDRRSPARRFKARATTLETGSAGSDGADLRRWEGIDREALHAINRAEVERLIAKARAAGPASLTPDERAALNRFAER